MDAIMGRTYDQYVQSVSSALDLDHRAHEFMCSMRETWISLIDKHFSAEEIKFLREAFVILSSIQEDKITEFNKEFMAIAMNNWRPE